MEQRLGDLEAQIERLTLALARWRESEEHRQPVEHRLAELTEQCADVLRQWTVTSERHAHAAGELETRLTGWNDVETRLHRDASSRFQGLERTIEREWASLRHVHEAPVRELREQAETLTEISVNAAGSAQTGLERAEARLATLEHDLHRRIDELARDIHAVLAELRQHGPSALRSPANSWSLDEVTRLHHELRDGASADTTPTVLDATDATAQRPTPIVAPQPAQGVESIGGERRATLIDRSVSVDTELPSETAARVDADESTNDARTGDESRRKWYAVFAVLALAIAAAAAFALSFYSKANQAAERASEAQQRAERIASAATQQIEAARQNAATQITEARDAASKAQVTTDVLAASDLVRFNLASGDPTARTSAQLLWSRSRGMVFSASRMPPLRPGAIYQVWLLTAGDPVSAATVAPDSSGRVTFASDDPPNVPRPINGVRVTVEPAPGTRAPSGPTVLGRLP